MLTHGTAVGFFPFFLPYPFAPKWWKQEKYFPIYPSLTNQFLEQKAGGPQSQDPEVSIA